MGFPEQDNFFHESRELTRIKAFPRNGPRSIAGHSKNLEHGMDRCFIRVNLCDS